VVVLSLVLVQGQQQLAFSVHPQHLHPLLVPMLYCGLIVLATSGNVHYLLPVVVDHVNGNP